MGYDDQAQYQNGDRGKTAALIAVLDYEYSVLKFRTQIPFWRGKMKKLITITMILMLMILISCASMSSSEKGALTGAGIGAVGGAAITAIAGGNAAVGAAIGGAAGAVAGGLIGGKEDKNE